jgi:hypothetical protein
MRKRTLSFRLQALALTVALSSTIGCAGQTGPAAPDVGETQHPLVASAKDWFRGIMFADGPVAESLPSIRDNFLLEDRVADPKLLSITRGQIEDLLATVDRLHPGKLEALKTEFISGVRPRISAALAESGRLTREAIDANGLAADPGQADQGLCLDLELDLTRWLYVGVIAVVDVDFVGIDPSSSPHTSETVVDDVARQACLAQTADSSGEECAGTSFTG